MIVNEQIANSLITPLIDGSRPMRSLLIAGVCTVALACMGSTQAQVFPSRPLTIVVPLPAGSAFDVTARLLAERLRVTLGQPVVVENPTGASGSVGTGNCA